MKLTLHKNHKKYPGMSTISVGHSAYMRSRNRKARRAFYRKFILSIKESIPGFRDRVSMSTREWKSSMYKTYESQDTTTAHTWFRHKNRQRRLFRYRLMGDTHIHNTNSTTN